MNYLDSINDKTILITGGTGSFGKNFIRNIYPYAKKVIIYSRDELKQSEFATTFEQKTILEKIRFFIGDVRDESRLKTAMNGVDIVVHAAALKQVPACEYNPFEAVKTNIFGSQNVIKDAIYNNVEQVVLLSTDKAVNPVNLYGATKMCAEKLFVQSNVYSPTHGGGKNTRLACVRYGNVVGSRGSVVPILIGQAPSGKVTITDKEMTRFWITLDQSAELVLYALSVMGGGEIFVPKLKASGIMDLVDVIAPDCEVEFIGKRPGEKVHEMLITEEEAGRTIDDKYCYRIIPKEPMWDRDKWPQEHEYINNLIYSSSSVDRMSYAELREFIEDFRKEIK
ncbi:MAG: UDP-N-acetylglucosamine 4,6-dehydratase (inverting) [Bacteroidetes bacterium 4572_77]|nr:MAG: UDP-N-acetylglucosamine 4,6-dehydratase (inverting) [Bacteroidetes bacterium 4572_77]